MMKRVIFVIAILLLATSVYGYVAVYSFEGGTGTDYTATVLGAWYMDQDTTTAESDETANGNNLTVSGGDSIPTSATVPSGYSGASRDFERADGDYLYQADAGGLDVSGADQAISLCLWWRPESIANDQALMADGGTGAGSRAWYLFYETATDDFQFSMSSDGTALTVATSATGAVVDTWIHVCVVSNDTDIRIYINGALDSNGADNPAAYTGGIYNNSDPFYLGSNGGIHADGLIDEALFEDSALSAADISNIYNDGIDGANGAND